jgi:glycosyltransferase involved in cell wall biosynthesis
VNAKSIFCDPQALADAIIRLAENRELRINMGRAGFELSRKNFDPKINIGKIHRIYEEVLKGTSKNWHMARDRRLWTDS